MTNNSEIDWSSAHLQEFILLYLQYSYTIFGITETRPLGWEMHKLERLGAAYGLQLLTEARDSYFRWLKDAGLVPRWRGYLGSADTYIKRKQQATTTRQRRTEHHYQEPEPVEELDEDEHNRISEMLKELVKKSKKRFTPDTYIGYSTCECSICGKTTHCADDDEKLCNNCKFLYKRDKNEKA